MFYIWNRKNGKLMKTPGVLVDRMKELLNIIFSKGEFSPFEWKAGIIILTLFSILISIL